MRRASLLLSLAIGAGGLACDSPTAVGREGELTRFALSEESARSFDGALRDVRQRVLPVLSDMDASSDLAPLLDVLAHAISMRDQRALVEAIARVDDVIRGLERGADADIVASDLDALRLILDHARPLAADANAAAH
jgi:hypothetical protein